MPLGTLVVPQSETSGDVLSRSLGQIGGKITGSILGTRGGSGGGKGGGKGGGPLSNMFNQKSREDHAIALGQAGNLNEQQVSSLKKLDVETQNSIVKNMKPKPFLTPKEELNQSFKNEDRAVRDFQSKHGFEREGQFFFTDLDNEEKVKEYEKGLKDTRKGFAKERAQIFKRHGREVPESLKKMMRAGQEEPQTNAPKQEAFRATGDFVVNEKTNQIFTSNGMEWQEVFQDPESEKFFILDKNGRQQEVFPK